MKKFVKCNQSVENIRKDVFYEVLVEFNTSLCGSGLAIVVDNNDRIESYDSGFFE